MIRRLGAGLLVVCVAVSATSADDNDKELKKLQGTWKVVEAQVNGVRIPLEAFQKVVVVIDADKMVFKESNKAYDEIEIGLDPKAKPKEIEYRYVGGLKKGVREQGIYEVTGDQLKICLAQAKQKRPTEFASQKGTGQQLMVLKRLEP